MNTDFSLIKNSHFFAYEKFPIYFQMVGGDFVLYKPAGITLKVLFKDFARLLLRFYSEYIYSIYILTLGSI